MPRPKPKPTTPDGTGEAQALAASRLRHAVENTADYLEVVADLIREKGEARLVDVAARLGVTKATANKTLTRLQREGHVHSQPYRAIFLSASGTKIATDAKARHLICLEFLLAGGVSAEVAGTDAEGMEHHVSDETLELLKRLTSALKRGKV